MRSVKIFLLAIVSIAFSFTGSAQYVQPMRYDHYSVSQQMNVGSGTVRVTDPSAYLEVGPTSGGNKGFLVPRLSTAQRDAIASPTTGLMVYNTSTNAFNFFNGSSWTTFSSGVGGSGITQLGNTGWGLLRINDSTYSGDSSKLITKYQSEKSRDSLGSLIATKFSTADTASKWISQGWLSLLMKYSDTSGMLSGYVRSSRFLDSLANHTTRFNGVTTSLALKLNLSDTSPMLANYIRRQELKDTAAAIRSAIGGGGGGGSSVWGGITGTLSDQTDLQSALNAKLPISDTAGMLTNYPRISSFTAGRFALVNGSRSIYTSSKFNFSDATYPTMSMIGSDPVFYIGPSATLTNNPGFGHGAGAAIYGGATYKSVQFVDQISGGIQLARFYNSGGTLYNNLNGLVISNTLSSPSNYQGSYTIQRTVPYAVTGLNYHGFTDQTDFRVGTNSFNSFGSFVTIGNNRTSQGHFAAFQSVWYKDSSNRMQAIYDFVSAVSEAREGTIDSLYRFKVFEASNTGATIVRQYGIQIDNLTSATTNIGAWIYNNVGIGPTAHTPTEKLVVDGNLLLTGNIKTGDPGLGAGAWKLGTFQSSSSLVLNTAGYIEVTINGTNYWLALVDPPSPRPSAQP